jgi:hypothetical protein
MRFGQTKLFLGIDEGTEPIHTGTLRYPDSSEKLHAAILIDDTGLLMILLV